MRCGHEAHRDAKIWVGHAKWPMRRTGAPERAVSTSCSARKSTITEGGISFGTGKIQPLLNKHKVVVDKTQSDFCFWGCAKSPTVRTDWNSWMGWMGVRSHR